MADTSILNVKNANPFNDARKLSLGGDARSSKTEPFLQLNNSTNSNIKSLTNLVSMFEEYNILEYYYWTISENKNNITPYIPRLIATEYDIITSPMIQNLKFALAALGDNAVVQFADSTIKDKWADIYNQGADSIKKGIQDASDKLKKYESMKSIFQESEMDFEGDLDLKQKYNHLYTVKRTGKRFIFPYMDDTFLSLANKFSDTNDYLKFDFGAGTVDAGEIAKNALKVLSQLPALMMPGAYIQTPQYYDFNSVSEPSVTISFPLYNTVNSYQTERNMKFVKMFGLNNMPHRKSLLAVDPSRIYSVKIPGKVFMPYCYVASYDVKHIGNKSYYNKDIFPEAYSVSITFTSLLKFDVNMFKGQMNMNNNYMPPPSTPTVSDGTDKESEKWYGTKDEFDSAMKENAADKEAAQKRYADEVARREATAATARNTTFNTR
jgi:hypothetical protein